MRLQVAVNPFHNSKWGHAPRDPTHAFMSPAKQPSTNWKIWVTTQVGLRALSYYHVWQRATQYAYTLNYIWHTHVVVGLLYLAWTYTVCCRLRYLAYIVDYGVCCRPTCYAVFSILLQWSPQWAWSEEMTSLRRLLTPVCQMQAYSLLAAGLRWSGGWL